MITKFINILDNILITALASVGLLTITFTVLNYLYFDLILVSKSFIEERSKIAFECLNTTEEVINSSYKVFRFMPDTSKYAVGQKETRAWGTWEVLEVKENDEGQIVECKKQITLNPLSAISLQKHIYRNEVWFSPTDRLEVVVDHLIGQYLIPGKSITILKGTWHSIVNLNDYPVTFLETQVGLCQEDDIERLIDQNLLIPCPSGMTLEEQDKFLSIQTQKLLNSKESFHFKDTVTDYLFLLIGLKNLKERT